MSFPLLSCNNNTFLNYIFPTQQGGSCTDLIPVVRCSEKHRNIKIPQVQEQHVQLSSLKLPGAFYSGSVFTLKNIRYNQCYLWIQMHLHINVFFKYIFI